MSNRDTQNRKIVALSGTDDGLVARGRGRRNDAAVNPVGRGGGTVDGSVRDRGRGIVIDSAGSAGRGRGRGILIDSAGSAGRGRGRGIVIDAVGSIGRGRGTVRNTAGSVHTGRGIRRGNVTASIGGGGGGGSVSHDQFMQATSTNLPVILYSNVAEYFEKLRVPEQRQSKDSRSSKAHYGDNAIGYVQVKRSSLNCVVQARVTLETSVSDTPYFVSLTVDEITKDIIAATCNCQASNINCKHQTALIFWVLRRSEEPSPTSVACYWKKSILSTVKNIKSKTVDELSGQSTDLLGANDTLLKKFIEIGKETNKNAGVIRHSKFGVKQTLYMDHLIIDFSQKYSKDRLNIKDFIGFCVEAMSEEMCKKLFDDTKDQSTKSEWYYVRFGRITASKLFEALRCTTFEGSLVSSVMGSRGFKGNTATKRGQELEAEIFAMLKSSKYPTIEKCGIFLRSDMPIFGASPDGMTSDYVFEIKCPSKKKTVANFAENGAPTNKVFYQMQLQMAMSGKSKGMLIVADPEFETNKRFIAEIEVSFNKKLLDDVLNKCKKFWENAIFPILK